MRTKFNSIVLFATTCFFLIMITGCTTATLLTGLSSAPSGVSYASGFGSTVYSYQIVEYEDAVEAALRAAETLALENKYKDVKGTRADLRYIDEKDGVIDILVERRTAKTTFIQVDAGFFGSKGMSRLMLLQILDEIGEAGDFIEDWSN
ncbi:MAG: DUF3568 family protein [Desulfobacterales bacterium]|nr:MAG: DUF3568 family protein [Desulfobacterales bacterium]